MKDEYLQVRNYDKLQHSKTKRLPWIKMYDRLLEDYSFGRLKEIEQHHMMKIWLLANRTENKIANDPGWVRSQIRARSAVHLSEFVQHGFLETWVPSPNTLPANTVILSRETVDSVYEKASPDTEKDKERDKPSEEKLAPIARTSFDSASEKDQEILRLVAECRHRDNDTEAVFRHYGSRLPVAAFAAAREQLKIRRLDKSQAKIRHDGRYCSTLLREMVADGRYSRNAA